MNIDINSMLPPFDWLLGYNDMMSLISSLRPQVSRFDDIYHYTEADLYEWGEILPDPNAEDWIEVVW